MTTRSRWCTAADGTCDRPEMGTLRHGGHRAVVLDEPVQLDRDSFAWTVLNALVDTLTCSDGQGELTVTMVRTREAREVPP